MDIAIRQPMTVGEFLDWEERQELRYEFDGQRAIAMNGGTFAHEIIGEAIRAALRERLRGRPGHALGPSMKIDVGHGIRYPDAFVSLSSVTPTTTIMPEPVIVFEVISPGSAKTDRYSKLREYQSTPSIQQYVIFEQDSVAATVFTRSGDMWDTRVLFRADSLSMPAIGVDIRISEIYVDLDLPDLDDENDPPPTA